VRIMKISHILLWIAVVALAGFIAYQVKAPKTTLIEISTGSPPERVELACNIDKFKSLLESIDPNGSISTGGNGTAVNIRFTDATGNTAEVAGPPFKPVTPAPTGSMHVTQRVAYGSLTDLKAVLDCLGSSRSAASGLQTPVPTPTPTP